MNTDVLASATDANKLSGQVKAATEVLGQTPCVVSSDSGYCSAADVAKIDAQTTTVVMPTQQQIDKERSEKENPAAKAFAKDAFSYDAASDTYTCPAGQKLVFQFYSTSPNGIRQKNYRTQDRGVCQNCAHFGVCTTEKRQGRKIVRDEFEHIREQLNSVYESPQVRRSTKNGKYSANSPLPTSNTMAASGAFCCEGLRGSTPSLRSWLQDTTSRV